MGDETRDGVSYLMALKRGHQSETGLPSSPAEHPAQTGLGGSAAAAAPAPSGSYGGAEKRRSPRFPCDGSVQMRAEGCDVHTWATFTDVSLHGCYVEAQATYPANTILHLKMEANGIRFESKGSVRISYPYLGMGIAFVDMSDEARKQLRELLAMLCHPTLVMGASITSVPPATGTILKVPPIRDAGAAVQALVRYFEMHHMLTREDFLSTLVRSQAIGSR